MKKPYSDLIPPPPPPPPVVPVAAAATSVTTIGQATYDHISPILLSFSYILTYIVVRRLNKKRLQ